MPQNSRQINNIISALVFKHGFNSQTKFYQRLRIKYTRLPLSHSLWHFNSLFIVYKDQRKFKERGVMINISINCNLLMANCGFHNWETISSRHDIERSKEKLFPISQKVNSVSAFTLRFCRRLQTIYAAEFPAN